MILDTVTRILMGASVAHFTLGIVCGALLFADLRSIRGRHPALKPAKFGLSIGMFLGTMALLIPGLSIEETTRVVIAWLLVSTMVVEMIAIALQSARGSTSHFNIEGALNALTWRAMVLAIVVMTVVMALVAVRATSRPIQDGEGLPLCASSALAWRAALWIFLTSALSGFAMGGRSKHSVGGDDATAGLPIVDWSTTHGDLRVTHFFAVHAIQVLPALAFVLTLVPLAESTRVAIVGLGSLSYATLCLATFGQCLCGRPFVSRLGRDRHRESNP